MGECGRTLLDLTVGGRAAPGGSKTATPVMRKQGGRWVPQLDGRGRPIVKLRPASKFTKPWMDTVAKAARVAWAGLRPLEGPLWVDITVHETRPDSHFRQVDRQPVLKHDAPAYPHRSATGDSGKLRRAIEDALTGIVWIDDKRVVDGADRKRYAEENYVVIRVGMMAAQTAEDAGQATPPPPGQSQLLAA